MEHQLDEEIRRIVATHGRLVTDIGDVDDLDDLYFAGMTSQANINVMLALEAAFDIEFPEEVLRRSTFESIAAIRATVTALLAESVTP